MALACAVITVLAISGGEYDISPWRVVQILFGGGEGLESTIVWDWRMPRALAALLFGAALALSGLVFQSLTRNPLGSPDIIGLSTGAYSGALIAITIFGGGFAATTAGALAGGLLTALIVYLLAWRNGTHGFRLILVGIGISSVLASFNQYMVLRADLDTAMSAAVWGAGTLNGVSWSGVLPVGAVVLVIAAVLLYCARPLQLLQMGDDLAASLGLNAERAKLLLIVLAVALTSAVTALIGPVAFVALVSPQLARRILGSERHEPGAHGPVRRLPALLRRPAGPAAVRAGPAAGGRGHRVPGRHLPHLPAEPGNPQGRRLAAPAPAAVVSKRHQVLPTRH
ncbi:FecCD family ABC transporter permease [Glutamicibacter halophytocola]|uniref:FecCD family ABC transporter permease n=1 Tax=Glutamicibacter halophytocola TaxID=1933880 RepID=UPI003D2C57AF